MHPTLPVPPEITYGYSGESDSYIVKMEGAGAVYQCSTRREAKMFIAELKGRLLMNPKNKVDDSEVIRIEPEMINEAGNENIPLLMSIMLIAIVIACIAVVGLAFSV